MDLTKVVDLENVSIDLEATHPDSGEKAKEVFCAGWPATRSTLQFVQVIVKNVIVRAIVGIVIALGDGIANRICGDSKPEETQG